MSAGATHEAADPSRPCALSNVTDVLAAFGGKVAAGQTGSDPSTATQCTFAVTGSNLGGDGEAVVYFATVQSRSSFDAAKAGLPGAVDVPGVGDAAFYLPATAALQIAKGDTIFSVQAVFGVGAATKPDPSKIQADVVALGKSVAAGL